MKHDVFYMTTKRFIPMQLAMQLQMLNVLSNSNYQNMKKLLSVLALMLCAICCMAGNKIYYTTSDGQKMPFDEDYALSYFGEAMVSHTYEDGVGIITFVRDITDIEGDVFRSQSTLTSITIPNSVTTIRESTFRGCSQLTTITIPNSVTSIGEYAFAFCTSLTSIFFGTSVTRLDRHILEGCENIKEVVFYAEHAPSTLVDGFVPGNPEFEDPDEYHSGLAEADRNDPFGLSYSELENVTLYIPAISYGYNAYPWTKFETSKTINGEGKKALDYFLDLLLIGESISTEMQTVVNECRESITLCQTPDEAYQILDEFKPKLIRAWGEQKKAQLEAAKNGVSNDYVNGVYNECRQELIVAVVKRDIGAIRQATTSGIAAVTSARILYKYLEQGIAPVTPAGAGMRMKVTTQSDKVYEFKTKDVKSVEYYNKN